MSVDFTTTLTPYHATSGHSSSDVKLIFNTSYSDAWDEVNDGDEQGPFPTDPQGDVLAQYVRFKPTGAPTTGGITYTLDGSSLIERDFPIIIGHSEDWGSVYIEYDSTLLNQNYDKFVIVDKETTVNEVGPPESWTTTITYGGRATANLLTKSSTGSSSTWGPGYYTFHEQADNKTRVAIYSGGYEYHLQIKPKVSSGGGDPAIEFSSSAIFSVQENQTAVGTVEASGGDGITLTYSIITGQADDAAKFSINSTGVLAFNSAPDFETLGSAESSNTYYVTVQATDGTSQVTQNITVNVTDVSESTTIVITTTTFTVNENQTSVGTIGTTGGDGSTKTYSITDAADGSSFNIVGSTGVLTFKEESKPDFETKTSYTINVKVVDTEYTVTEPITVNIGNVQEGHGTTLPTISGTASEGETLTASTTGISDPDKINGVFSYQWKNSSGATVIGTNSTYTVASTDVGTTITVTVTYTDGFGAQQSLTSAGTTVAALDDKIYFWTEYNGASNNTAIHYAIYNATKVSGVQFTYDVSGSTTVADVSYSIVDNSNNNTAVYKKEWLQIINNTTSEVYKSMLFWGNVNQTLNGMVTGTFAIIGGNVTLDSVLGITNHLSENIDPSTDNVILAEPQNPPTIENPGGRILGDLNFDASLNNTDADIMSAYLLNDTDISFNTYDSNGVEITPKKTAQEIIDEMMGGEWLEHVDINANGHVDVGDLVRILSKIADPTFNMSSGL